MGDLPGFSAADQAKPPTKSELAAIERQFKDLALYWDSGCDEAATAKAMKVSKAQARIRVNRATAAWRERIDEFNDSTYAWHADLLRRMLGDLSKAFFGGDYARTADMLKVMERQAKLQGLDAAKEESGGPQIVVIDSRNPWDRPETIDGEASDDPPALPATT